MNPHYNIYEEIDRYLDGEMSETELLQFNARLSTDNELQQLVDAQRTANEIIVDQELIRLKERMQQDLSKDTGKDSSTPWGKIILFSAVITSAALYTYIHQQENKNSEEPVPNEKVSSTSSPLPTVQPTPAVKEEQPVDVQVEKTPKNNTVTIPSENTPDEKVTSQDIPETKGVATLANPNVVEEQNKNTIPINKSAKEELSSPPATDKKNECDAVQFKANAYVDYSFDGKAFIVIEAQTVKGGTAPYSYALNGSSYSKQTKIQVFQDGSYKVFIQDAHNCQGTAGKTLDVKLPAQNIDEAFSPSQGERWKFPLREQEDASITIYNKTGSMVYATSISNGYPEDWDGRSNSGVELETGNYYFVIQYSDRDQIKGHVSIIR